MQNLIAIWTGLSLRRRAVVGGATLSVFLAVLALARLAGNPGTELLYAGLEGRAAGEIMAALDQRGVSYQVKGDSIYVPAGQRDQLRMALAGEGLPAAGGTGYELLDTLSGFGTTSQMFDAAYWRAKEGELARTILAMPGVRAARVHISQGPEEPFRATAAPTASVTLTTTAGSLSDDQARALRHLVASAVAGMRPANVQVIDAVGGLVGATGDGEAGTGTAASDRAAAIRASVERLLAARVGPGRAVVEVSIDLVNEREQITERLIDPEGRVAISSETQETTSQATEPGGEVTVASNLPEGDAGDGAAGKTQSSETRERVNYEVSETQRELTRTPGGIRRMTVAVLVDGTVTAGADGASVWEPRGEEELAALRELVAAAVGLDESRGDVLTLRSLEFSAVPAAGTEATEASLLAAFGPFDTMAALRIGALALVALVLGLFVLRPVLAPARTAELPPPMQPLALTNATRPAGAPLTGEIDDGYPATGMPVIDLVPDSAGAAAEDPASRLRRLIGERQAESIEILRGWLEPEEERA